MDAAVFDRTQTGFAESELLASMRAGDPAAFANADRDRDRATLMARAQAGERETYRRLLEDIAPFIRALASRRLRDPSEVEDAVQDVLLTVHLIRHT